jgi:L-rhamnose mutarotase
MNKYCFALDLKDDPALIKAYEAYHNQIWPEIVASIKDAGITKLEIYRYANRLMMLMEVDESYSPERKAAMDAANEKVQDWENLMWKYQQALPGVKPGEKWMLMNRIFEL